MKLIFLLSWDRLCFAEKVPLLNETKQYNNEKINVLTVCLIFYFE